MELAAATARVALTKWRRVMGWARRLVCGSGRCPLVPEDYCRCFTKARTTYTLICAARGLLRMVAAMMAPCSVNATGRYFLWVPRPVFKVANCDLKAATS